MAKTSLTPDVSVPLPTSQHRVSAAPTSYTQRCGFTPTDWHGILLLADGGDPLQLKYVLRFYKSSSLGPMAQLDARFTRTARGRLQDPTLKSLNNTLMSLIKAGHMRLAARLYGHMKEAADAHFFLPAQAR